MGAVKWVASCLAVAALLLAGGEAVGVDDALELLSTAGRLAVQIFQSWDLIGSPDGRPEEEKGGGGVAWLRTREERTVARIAELGRQIARLEGGAHARGGAAADVAALARDLPARVRLDARLDALADVLGRLGGLARQLDRYAAEWRPQQGGNATALERHTLEDFAGVAVGHGANAVRTLLERLHLMVAQHEIGLPAKGVLQLISDATQEDSGLLCNQQQSPQQMVYNVYTAAALAELKGYAMMQFSWMLLRIYEKGNFTSEARLMRERYEERAKQKASAARAAMAQARRDIHRCDPRAHVEGETFEQVTRLLQGHIQNEVDLNGDATCRENCAYYSYTKSHGCYHNLYCAKQQRCNGKLIDCKYYDSDMWICQADGGASATRRYDWIEYENGRVLGQKASCRRGTTKVDSWWRWLFWHCSYCFCLCDEQGPKSDRYFNLRPAKANVTANMVVTGLRFVKHRRVIHVQVHESALLPGGRVDPATSRWRPVDDYAVTDADAVAGRDYHTLSWEQRALDLDDLVAPPGHALTGFRFRRVGAHLNPEIMATPFYFSTGVLVTPDERSVWLGNDNTDAALHGPRTRLDLGAADVPTRSPLPSRPDSAAEQFVLFGPSDADADAAQTTVPFLDGQPLVADPPALLAGAGLFHKGRPGYGGFVAPRLLTYDFSDHVRADFPPPPPPAE